MTGARLAAAVRLDVRVQARSRLYTIGVAVAVLLGVVVRFLIPPEHRAVGLAGFYTLTLGGTTYMFSAVTLLGDKSQNTLDALRVSPMDASTYVASKVVTLSTFALVEAVIVYAVGGGWPVPLAPLVAGIALLSVLYTLLGLAQVAPHDSVTSFLMPDAIAASMILQLPVLSLFDVGPSWLWSAIPSMPALRLMLGAELALGASAWAYVAVYGLASLGLSARFAIVRLRRHAGLR